MYRHGNHVVFWGCRVDTSIGFAQRDVQFPYATGECFADIWPDSLHAYACATAIVRADYGICIMLCSWFTCILIVMICSSFDMMQPTVAIATG